METSLPGDIGLAKSIGLLALFLCLASCKPKPKPADWMAHLAPAYELPAGETYYSLQVLQFERGELKPLTLGTFGFTSEKARTMHLDISWGERGGSRWVSAANDSWSGCGVNPFWGHLDGKRYGFGENARYPKFGGYTILAFAQSKAKQHGKDMPANPADFEDVVKKKQYVGALGIKTFHSKEELDEEMFRTAPASRPGR